MNRLFQLFAAIFIFLSTAVPAARAVEGGDKGRIERLAKLAEVWAVAKFLHPSLAYQQIDWDAAVISAIQAVRRAENDAEFVEAVARMLAALEDPSSRIVQKRIGSPRAESTTQVTSWLRDKVLLVDLRGHGDYAGELRLQPKLADIKKEMASANAIILDLRAVPEDETPYVWFPLNDLFGSALVSRDSVAPAQRFLVHSGYRPQSGTSSGGYFSAFQLEHQTVFRPEANSTPKRVILLVNEFTVLPNLALALQAAGNARIIGQGPVVDGWVPYFRRVDLTDQIEAWIRTSELMAPGGRVRFDATVPVATEANDAAKTAALRLLDQKKWDRISDEAFEPLPAGRWQAEKTYAEMKYPPLEYRLLAVFRIWSVIHYFYPYLHLIGDWDAAFRDAIPSFENAQDGAEYVRAVLQLLTHVADGHTSAFGHPEIDRLYGDGRIPVNIRFVEGKPLVAEIWDNVLTKAGLDVGDILTAVDGVPVTERTEFLKRFVTASTTAATLGRIGGLLLRGPDGSKATLTVQKGSGVVRDVSALRRKDLRPPEKTSPAFKTLPGNLGYVDLRRLTVEQVDPMFEELRLTRGIIFDLRGYPRGTAWPIAPRINTQNAVYAASFRRSMVAGNLDEEMARSGWFFDQALPKGSKWKYTAPTVMLIDDRTISQAEHTGLFFEAANGTKFVGSNSAGTNGDVTNLFVPGGIRIGFTGHDVRHADGRQLQRIGLVPDVVVEPTIAGIRRGEDEVLARAIRYMEELTRPK